MKKTMVNISTALEGATDITGAGLIVAKQRDLTPFALFQQSYLCVILLESRKKKVKNSSRLLQNGMQAAYCFRACRSL